MRLVALGAALCLLLLAAGCTQSPGTDRFNVDGDGWLAIALAPDARVNATALNTTVTRVVFTADDGVPVTAYVAAPAHPKAAVVYVPGANEPVTGHASRFASYPDARIAFLYLDVRGNGFETPGTPLDLNADYARFRADQWPQSYRIIADVMHARAYLAQTYGVPVWAVGSSNGGRYAAVAAGIDPAFAGYAGVSTSGLGTKPGAKSVAQRFDASVDPATYIGAISPRQVLIYHSQSDTIIPFARGQALFTTAGEPKAFVPFNGSHGINPEVDADLIGRLTQIYGR
ncbi:MAG TPA: alpha/beta hydrolase [Methanoregulaceae archaeon]|nr:alpha/beta hydrolase [Methanoregulaceae archaeon]